MKKIFLFIPIISLMFASFFSLPVQAATTDQIVTQLQNYLTVQKDGTVQFDIERAKKDKKSSDFIMAGVSAEEYTLAQDIQFNPDSEYTANEYHGNFCGPRTQNMNAKPVDILDAQCKKHDLCYSKTFNSCQCDRGLIADVKNIMGKLSGTKKVKAQGILAAMYAKLNTPLGCKNYAS